ncbi:MAG: cytochrome d ubiquinol oxidase subunit II [Alphaproteobacteria bacterium]|nr:cytochrome d ubiquinol oxidase subunit II [Alphaproteobacteria bacterium]
MSAAPFDLVAVWAVIIAFGVLMYVVLDGFDLGVGMLFPLFKERGDRDAMMNSVAPVWDGNETWLVLGGVGLFAAFPLAYAVILPALYLPLVLMLIALVFRGVAFEFRFKSRHRRWLWDAAFAGGSTVAALTQGVALGAFIQGIKVADRAFAGGPFDWLTPFSLMTGVGLAAGYAMLGCGWLIMKTEGPLQQRCFALMAPLGLVVLGFVAAVSLWTPFLSPAIADRWFSWPNLAYLSPVPLLVAIVALALWRALRRRRQALPFVLTLCLFVLSYLGLGISLWPHAIPPSVTIWQAASSPEAQRFLIVGVLVLIPVILGYTGYAYWVFRGKVTGAGYHS